MECNKDEATRAKEIAEKKFNAKDIYGARKFALKAQNLYPGLEGLTQMLATLEVYINAENKINGETDWYGILGVNQLADEDTIRKQYRKFALMLHPDKNKSIGGDGPFKLISEAWSLLSDKAKRVAYDQKRSARVFQKATTSKGPPPATQGANGFDNFTKSTSTTTTTNVRAQKNATATRKRRSSATTSSHKPKLDTFWTVCHGCKMQYEYFRNFLNSNLMCPECHESFLAVETAPPQLEVPKLSHKWNFSQKLKESNRSASKNTSIPKKSDTISPNVGSEGLNNSGLYNHSNFQWGPFSQAAGMSTTAQAATVVQQAYEKVKKEREEAQAAMKKEALRRKHAKRMSTAPSAGYFSAAKRRKGMDDIGERSYGKDFSTQMGMGSGGVCEANLAGSKQVSSETGRVSGITNPSFTWEVSHKELQNMLMSKARVEICKKINGWNSASVVKTAVRMEAKEKLKVNYTNVQKEFANTVDMENGLSSVKSFSVTSDTSIDTEMKTITMNVPDSDFHDFDKDRSERCFGDNQVWAAYDNDDGMPRYYAMIHSLISLNPFKTRISWLNSKTNNELGPLTWIGSGFSKTCGDFRIGKYEINKSLNSFSHKVRWAKGARGAIFIYPRIGEVWALYRNWCPDWNELTADEVIHKYDMVEVLEDYNEEQGVTVTPLVKVAGFKTVFHRHLDPREVRRIPREEMFRFSHQVPSYLLTGQEAANAPKGCRELDPAATPLELLQVVTDGKEDEFSDNNENIMDKNILDNLEELVGNTKKHAEEEKMMDIDIQERPVEDGKT